MSVAFDFQARLDSINKILAIGEAATAASECVKLIEQALRQVVNQHIEQMDERVRRAIEESAQKKLRGKGGLEGSALTRLTMGQMIYTLRDAGFWNEWARITGKSLNSLQVIDFEKLAQLRNRVMHDSVEATRTEAEFLLHGLRMILETFGLLTFPAPAAPEQPQSGRSHRRQSSELPTNLRSKIIEFLKTLPNLDTPAGQRAFIFDAGLDADLRDHIQFGLPLAQFVPFLLSQLLSYGELQDGRAALSAVLETGKQYIGQDRRAACETLIREIEAYLNTTPGQPDNSREHRPTTPSSQDQQRGGVQFGNLSFGKIKGNVNVVQASGDIVGDIVAGNHVTNVSSDAPAGTKPGLTGEAERTDCLQHLENVRVALREIRKTLGALDGMDENLVDRLTTELSQQITALQSVKETLADLPVGKAAPKESIELVQQYVNKTSVLLEKFNKMKSIALGAEMLAPTAANALSLFASIRQVFGLP